MNKTYVPKSKAKACETKIGQVLRLGFHASTLIDFIRNHQNQAGYINFDIVPRREIDQYGNTHSVVLNDWTPKEGYQKQSGGGPVKHMVPREDDQPPF